MACWFRCPFESDQEYIQLKTCNRRGASHQGSEASLVMGLAADSSITQSTHPSRSLFPGPGGITRHAMFLFWFSRSPFMPNVCLLIFWILHFYVTASSLSQNIYTSGLETTWNENMCGAPLLGWNEDQGWMRDCPAGEPCLLLMVHLFVCVFRVKVSLPRGASGKERLSSLSGLWFLPSSCGILCINIKVCRIASGCVWR